METEIEKRAEQLGVASGIYKSASILEGLALYGFHDELNKLAQDENNMKKDEEKKENGKGKEKEKGSKEDEGKEEGKGKEEKMSKKERFLAMIKKKKEQGKEKKKEMKKESSFSGGFKDVFEKTAALGTIAKKVAPYILGGAALGTAGYALHKQKKETAATRSAIQGLAAGAGRAVQGMSMRQRWNDMRDQINEGRLAKAVNVNRQAILQIMKKQSPGK